MALYPDRVAVFVSGRTADDYSHLGHARTYVVFDVPAKDLRRTGKEMFRLQNITDADLTTPTALAAIRGLVASGDLGALREYGEILRIDFLREAAHP